MNKERCETILLTTVGLLEVIMSAYATIKYGHCIIFDLGILTGSILTLAGLWDVLSWKRS